MTHSGFIFAAWGIVLAVLVLYSVHLVLRGRSLTDAVEPEHRRWLDSGAETKGVSHPPREQP